jgi:hypothetical protein
VGRVKIVRRDDETLGMKRAPRNLMILVTLSFALAVIAAGVAVADDAAQPSVTSADDLATLTAVSIQPTDLRTGFEILPYPAGTSVRGYVSLDVCGSDFPSEALRSGRSQVSVVPSDDPTFDQTIFATEAIMYQDDLAATQAMTELTAAAKNCPTSSFVEGQACTCHVGDQAPAKWQFHPAPDRRWKKIPGAQRVAFDVTIADKQGNSTREDLIYQRHGRLIVAIYGAPADIAYTVPGHAKAEQLLASTIAQRLAATTTT